jgi:rhodanese-related sulfurtransferase
MYKGDLSPREAFEKLEADPEAVLLDVRTVPEWLYVGLPAVDRLLKVSWQNFPAMEPNPRFVETVCAAGVPRTAAVLCICRSGQRSALAAQALAAAGFEKCYNVAEGFEGDRDVEGHRATVGGWKVAGLPWVQN